MTGETHLRIALRHRAMVMDKIPLMTVLGQGAQTLTLQINMTPFAAEIIKVTLMIMTIETGIHVRQFVVVNGARINHLMMTMQTGLALHFFGYAWQVIFVAKDQFAVITT